MLERRIFIGFVQSLKRTTVILQGNLAANGTTFPSGMRALADYVHGKGLKLGVYGDAGYALYRELAKN